MPFSSTASVTSTDMNNMLRGLYRDNSDTALTGTTAQTDLKSLSISANTIGTTGGIYIQAAGSTAGTAGTKTINANWGGTNLGGVQVTAPNTDKWMFEIWIYNTATNAQRIMWRGTSFTTGGTVNNHLIIYETAAIDTTANVTLKFTGTLANAGDTITQAVFDVYVAQIT